MLFFPFLSTNFNVSLKFNLDVSMVLKIPFSFAFNNARSSDVTVPDTNSMDVISSVTPDFVITSDRLSPPTSTPLIFALTVPWGTSCTTLYTSNSPADASTPLSYVLYELLIVIFTSVASTASKSILQEPPCPTSASVSSLTVCQSASPFLTSTLISLNLPLAPVPFT